MDRAGPGSMEPLPKATAPYRTGKIGSRKKEDVV